MSLSTETIAYVRRVAANYEAGGLKAHAANFRAMADHEERKNNNAKCPTTCRECEKLAGLW